MVAAYHPNAAQPIATLFDMPRAGLSRAGLLPALLSSDRPEVVHTATLEPRVATGGYRRLFGAPGYRPNATLLLTAFGRASATVYRRVSDAGYFSDHDDSPADTGYAARLDNALNWRRTLVNGGLLWGRSATRAASITVNNYNQHVARGIDNSVFDGRTVTVRFGRPGWAHRNFATVFKGVYRRASSDFEITTIEASGISYRLEIPVQADTYAGTGGAEGGDDLKDKPKPLSFGGQHRRVSPVLVKASGPIYHLTSNSGAASIDGVWDKGAAITLDTGIGSSGAFATFAALDSASPASGKYGYVLDDGGNAYIKLGSLPEGGEITVDFTTSSSVTRPGSVMKQIITEQGGLTESNLETGSFAGLDSEIPHDIQLWIGPGDGNRAVARFLDDIVKGLVAWWADDRYAKIKVGYLKRPGVSYGVEITDADIIGYRRRALPGDLEPAVKIARVGYARNYTPQTGDLAGSASDAYKAFARAEYRFGAASNATTSATHTEARTLELPSMLVDETAADAIAGHIVDDLFDKDAELIEIDTNFRSALISIGDVVRVNSDELRITATYRVVGASYDAADLSVTLTLLR